MQYWILYCRDLGFEGKDYIAIQSLCPRYNKGMGAGQALGVQVGVGRACVLGVQGARAAGRAGRWGAGARRASGRVERWLAPGRASSRRWGTQGRGSSRADTAWTRWAC